MYLRSLVVKVVGMILLGGLPLQVGCTGSQVSSGTYRAELGQGPSPRLIADVTAGILRDYGYQLQNVNEDRVETDWRMRGTNAVRSGPASDPSGFSVREDGVRDRARVQINRRGNRFFVARLTMVHEKRTEGGEWEREEPSEEVLEQYQNIERRIKDRLQQYMTQR